MYTLDIICSDGHQFEAWFSSRNEFEEQLEESLISCPICGDMNVQQALTPIRIKKDHDKSMPRQPIPDIEENFENVGEGFAEEVIRIFTGESEERNIYGTATDEEQEELIEEGILFVKLPDLQ